MSLDTNVKLSSKSRVCFNVSAGRSRHTLCRDDPENHQCGAKAVHAVRAEDRIQPAPGGSADEDTDGLRGVVHAERQSFALLRRRF